MNGKPDTPWDSVLNLSYNVKPEERALYTPPFAKKVADLQSRILHGVRAVNTFVPILNPEVKRACPFCGKRETVFMPSLSLLQTYAGLGAF